MVWLFVDSTINAFNVLEHEELMSGTDREKPLLVQVSFSYIIYVPICHCFDILNVKEESCYMW